MYFVKKPFIFQSGFTLIEVMVTVVIVAILAAIAMPSYTHYIQRANIKAAQSDLVALGLVYENFYQRNLSYPSTDYSSTSALTNATTGFPQWSPTKQDVFEFSAAHTENNKGYTLTATAKSSSNLNGCSFSINEKNIRTINNCHGVTW